MLHSLRGTYIDCLGSCKEDPQPVLVRVGNSKCWQLDRRLLSQCSEYFENALAGQGDTSHFELKDEDPDVFDLFVNWMYSWNKHALYAYVPDQIISSSKSWRGVTYADAWLMADRLGATQFSNCVLGWYIQATIDGGDSSFLRNRLIANTMAKLLDTQTLSPALRRFARHWTEWCVAEDLKIAEAFKITSLGKYVSQKKEEGESSIFDPRKYVFEHWFAECSKAPTEQSQCDHSKTWDFQSLPTMRKRVEKPKRDYYGEIRDWATKSLPHLTSKNIGAIVSVSLQV